MKRKLHPAGSCALAVLALAISTTAHAVGYYAYIPNSAANTVSVIDTETNTVVDTITVGFGPQGIEVHPDGTRVYVGNNGNDGDGNTVSVIDTATRTVIDTITLPVDGGPEGMGFTPDGRFLYVTTAGIHNLPPDGEFDTVAVIDTNTNTVVDIVDVEDHPWDAEVTNDGNKVYVSNGHSENLSIIDPLTNTVTNTLLLGDGLNTGNDHHTAILQFNPDQTELWVTHMHFDMVSIVDTATDTIKAQISTQRPGCPAPDAGFGPCEHSMGMAFHPSGNPIFITSMAQNEVLVKDSVTYADIARVFVGDTPKTVSVHPDGDRLYVGLQFENSVAVMDANTYEVLEYIAVGSQPIPFGNFFVAKEDTAPGVGAIGTNTVLVRATCQNAVTRQRTNVRQFTDNAFECGDFGFTSNSGDPINLTVNAIVADATSFGGTLTGADTSRTIRATCTNLRNSESVTFTFAGTETWDCAAAGLNVTPGTQVAQVLRFVSQ